MTRLMTLAALIPLLNACYIFPTCGSGECPEPDPVRDGLYALEDAERPDVVDAILDVQGDTVVLEYVDDLGNTWEVEYVVTARTPEEEDPLFEPWD